MTDKQPEALSIAKRLKNQQQPLSLALREKAAAELRRLHEENEALRARLAQPEQEPVAKYSDIISDGGLDPRNKFDTAPPQREWQGLTDEEIVELAGGGITRDERMIARAIEAKLKEKNAPASPS